MVENVSAGLIVRDKKILTVFDNSNEEWKVPCAEGKSDEISSQTAERAVEEELGVEGEVTKYRGKLKTKISKDSETINWQPYSVEIEETPDDGKWIDLKNFDSDEVAEPLPEIAEDLSKKF